MKKLVVASSNPGKIREFEQMLKPLGFEGGPELVCQTLAEGPFGIESQADVDGVRRRDDADADRAPEPDAVLREHGLARPRLFAR